MHKGPSTSVAFSNNGTLYSCGYDTTVIRWDCSRKAPVWAAAHDGLVNDLAVRGNMVASVGADRKIRFWDVADGQPAFATSPTLSDDPNSVVFLDDDHSVIVCTDDGKIIRYNYRNASIVWERSSCLPNVYGESVEAVAVFNESNEQCIFFGDGSGNIGVLDECGQDKRSSKVDGTIDCCVIDQETLQAYCGLSSGALVVINLENLETIARMQLHCAAIKSIAVTGSHEIVTISYDDVIKILDTDLKTITFSSIADNNQRGWSRSIALNPKDKDEICVTSLGDTPLLISRQKNNLQPTNFPGPTHGINCIDTRHGKIVLGVDDGCLWAATANDAEILSPLGSMVLCCRIHPFKYVIASGTQAGDVWINDLTIGTKVAQIEGDNSPVVSLCYSSGGEYLAIGHYSGLLRVVDGCNLEHRLSIEFNDAIKSITFLGEEERLCLGIADGSLTIVDIPTKVPIHTFDNVFLPNAVGWNTATSRIISVGRDLFVRSWTKSLQMEHTSTNHTRSIKSLAISPDGSHFLTAGYDSVISLWADMKVLNEFSYHDLPGIAAISWIDSHNFVSGGWDGKLCLAKVGGQLLSTVVIGGRHE